MTVVQRVLPAYRVPFFSRLRDRLGDDGGTLSLVAGSPRADEGIVDASRALDATTVANRPLAGSMWQRRVVAAVRSTDPDVVVIEANPRMLSNVALLAWCRRRQVPAVGWGAGKLDRPRVAVVDRGSEMSLRLQLALCRGALGYGEVAAATFSRLGPSGLAVGVAPNATMRVDRDIPDRPGPGEACPTFLFVGRFVEQKRADVLIDAAAILEREGFAFRLVMAGDGPEDAKLRARASAMVSVDFIGHCEPAMVPALMGSAHALVLPGRGGLVVQEALVHGLPVAVGPTEVAGDGTVHRLLEGSPAAVVAADASAAQFAEAMRRVVDPGAWRVRSQAAANLAARHGGLDAMVDAFLDVLSRVR